MKINLIDPANIPVTTDRVVLMHESELARLKQITAETITALFETAHFYKMRAKQEKLSGFTEDAHTLYKARVSLLRKANKLGEVQKALKNNAVTNAGLIERMYSEGLIVGVFETYNV